MAPTLVMKGDKPYFVVGTPGGTTIPTSVYQTLLNILDFGLDAQQAVNNPKFHHQWLPDEVLIEPNFLPETKSSLEKMGYKLINRSAIGRVELIKVNTKNQLETVADKRGDDSVAGY